MLKNILIIFFSTCLLKILQLLHMKPINVIICYIYLKTSFEVNFSLKMHSAIIYYECSYSTMSMV